jgi:hypothetical protein
MPYKKYYPYVRISPLAKKHLARIVRTLKGHGEKSSEASFATSLILAQPLPAHPNGATQAPVHEEEK